MITLNIDKTTFNKDNIVYYLRITANEIENGKVTGDDWELVGKEELESEIDLDLLEEEDSRINDEL